MDKTHDLYGADPLINGSSSRIPLAFGGNWLPSSTIFREIDGVLSVSASLKMTCSGSMTRALVMSVRPFWFIIYSLTILTRVTQIIVKKHSDDDGYNWKLVVFSW